MKQTEEGGNIGSIPAWAGKPHLIHLYSAVPGVYPRVGGETKPLPWTAAGLSPRGRGNPVGPSGYSGINRSIPAWAGKPASSSGSLSSPPVYPRVGGETLAKVEKSLNADGLSPRGRGNRRRAGGPRHRRGSIPAWAGKPVHWHFLASCSKVYPRVGGETMTSADPVTNPGGLSPRGRGNRLAMEPRVDYVRSIPAWAGKPKGLTKSSGSTRVYPRVGGETTSTTGPLSRSTGLSPRGRGNPSGASGSHTAMRSIPAWAGKPVAPGHAAGTGWVYPRVGGETLRRRPCHPRLRGLSPRGRGNLLDNPRALPTWRSIPAWAGKPSKSPGCGS